VRGTMAHSWIMVFASEQEAFEKYAETYPDNCMLLIDTYDTLGSGLDNAIAAGLRLSKSQRKNFGVRLDSGDLEYLSKKVRERLDAAGLREAKIVASNELDENIIHHLVTQGAPIDVWGVGTSLVTGGDDPALTGVYKIVAREEDGAWVPTIKVSNNPEKVTNPGIKQVWRFEGREGTPLADLVAMDDEPLTPGRSHTFHHPMGDYRSFTLEEYRSLRPLLGLKVKDGRIACESPALPAIQQRARRELDLLDDTYKRLINPHLYRISLSDSLNELKSRLIRESLAKGTHA
jgi:nicotinate phosphoribosyltransferase